MYHTEEFGKCFERVSAFLECSFFSVVTSLGISFFTLQQLIKAWLLPWKTCFPEILTVIPNTSLFPSPFTDP